MFFLKNTFFTTIKDFSRCLWDLVMPSRCGVCGAVMGEGENAVCGHCMSNIMYTDFALIRSNPMEQKLHMITGENILAMALCVYSHDGCAGKVVEAFKYHHRRDLALWAGKMTGQEMKHSKIWENYDMLVPIPLHRSREKKRGYNQSMEICKGITSICEIEICEALCRPMRTTAQARLSRAQRWLNAENIFSLSPHTCIKGKNVIVVDDVFTTGATLGAAVRSIRKAGANKIAVVTFAAGE